jgi:predicted adenylyl cyclase CyaB
MRNIELKARLHDRDAAEQVCRDVRARPGGLLRQTDTYFHADHGRLKLRETTGGDGRVDRCLITYYRPDDAAPRASEYAVTPVPPNASRSLQRELRVLAVVRKERSLYLWEGVRIHLDAVETLGDFIEFEAVLGGDCDEDEGHRLVAGLRARFGIADTDLVARSYVDLLLDAGGDDAP